MSGRVWGGDPGGQGRHPAPKPAPMLVLPDADHPRLADLDGWLDGNDAPRTQPAPLVPRDREFRNRDRTADPGTINPPGGRVRRNGEGAQYITDLRGDSRRYHLDALHEQLGDYLNEPELEAAKPAVTTDPGAVVKIDKLAMMLERKWPRPGRRRREHRRRIHRLASRGQARPPRLPDRAVHHPGGRPDRGQALP